MIPAAPGQGGLAESLGIESFQRLGKPTQGIVNGDKWPRVMLLEVRRGHAPRVTEPQKAFGTL